jgi:uncharacterized phiE125 gp8 family phage protein
MPTQSHFATKILTPPASEPVSVIEAQQHLRIDGDYDNDLISGLISTARELVVAQSGRALMEATYRLSLDRFPLLPNTQFAPGNPNVVTPVINNVWPLDPTAWGILLPRSPLIAVTSFSYYDVNGVLQTLDPSAYIADGDSEPPRIAPSSGASWPSAQFRPNAVQICFTAGYPSADLVPAAAKHAIKLLIGSWYDNRNAVGSIGDEIALAFSSLVDSFSVPVQW